MLELVVFSQYIYINGDICLKKSIIIKLFLTIPSVTLFADALACFDLRMRHKPNGCIVSVYIRIVSFMYSLHCVVNNYS